MKKITIAFLYNVRHRYPDPKDPKTLLEADCDDPQTIDFMLGHLERAGFSVIPVEADEKAYFTLFEIRKKIDLAFNYSIGLYGSSKYSHIPAMLDMLQIPYTGGGTLTQALVLNKVKMKEILLANNLSTLPYQDFSDPEETTKIKLKFPLIVKPIAQGSSAGISNKSVVRNKLELKKQVTFLLNVFNQPVFVEPFLDSREFSIPLLGNPPKTLPFIEPNFKLLPKKFLPLDSLEVKWIYEEEAFTNHLVCPAELPFGLKKEIETLVKNTWSALNIRDFCRIDVRIDKKGTPYVLDVNSPAGLVPPEVSMTSYFPLAAREAKIDYKNLLTQIINCALQRYHEK